MKLSGGILVSVSVLLLGMSLYSRLKKRKVFLGEILLFLSNVKIEIEYINLPLYQVLKKIQYSGICRNLSFISSCVKKIDQGEDFSEAWFESVSNSFLPMKKEERENDLEEVSFMRTSA
jgi:UDP-N-acetylglucosamine pyrophosphorylase